MFTRGRGKGTGSRRGDDGGRRRKRSVERRERRSGVSHSEGSRAEAGRGPEKDRRKNGEGIRSDQTYAAPDTSPLSFVTSRVQSAFGTGPPRRVASLNRAIYRCVQLPSITANPGKHRGLAVVRRHFNRQVRSANDAPSH